MTISVKVDLKKMNQYLDNWQKNKYEESSSITNSCKNLPIYVDQQCIRAINTYMTFILTNQKT